MSMEQVFFRIHARTSNLALRRTTPAFRSLVEHAVLLLAVGSFVAVVVCHKTFVHRAAGSGGGGPGTMGAGVGASSCLLGIDGFDAAAGVTNVYLRRDEIIGDGRNGPAPAGGNNHSDDCGGVGCGLHLLGNSSSAASSFVASASPSPPPAGQCADADGSSSSASLGDSDEWVFSYSRTKGYLLLPGGGGGRGLSHYGISSQDVVVSVHDTKCFGDSFLRSVIWNVTGPDTIVLNWFLALHDGGGYMYDARRDKLVDLHYAYRFLHRSPSSPSSDEATAFAGERKRRSWGAACLLLCGSFLRLAYFVLFKAGVLLTSLLLFFVTTTLVSFTLRETQEKMLHFTFLLQSHIRQRRPYGNLIFKHVVESLVFVPITVGMLFFLIEIFHGDKALAVMVLSVVWMCEIFSVMGMRTMASMTFFPRVYFLYFSLFIAYFFSCPYGFSYASLASTALFLAHAMLFFWNRYELPALQCGAISQAVPRQSAVGGGGGGGGGGVGVGDDATTSAVAAPAPAPAPRLPPAPRPVPSRAVVERHHGSMSPPLWSTRWTTVATLSTSTGSDHNLSAAAASSRNVGGPQPNQSMRSFPSSSSIGRLSVTGNTQGRISRVTSDGSVRFIDEDDYGEGDDSYMTFMNGEVVLHRDDRLVHFPSVSPNQIVYSGSRPGENASSTSSGSSSCSSNINGGGRGQIGRNDTATMSTGGPATDAAAAFLSASGQQLAQASGAPNSQRGPFFGAPPSLTHSNSSSLGDLLLASASSGSNGRPSTPRQYFYR